MPTITITEFDGTQHELELTSGDNLMQVAMDNGVSGIDGDCGGACACGTCHVFVDEQWLHQLPEPEATERGMLATRPDLAPNSRLGCQIVLDEQLDGLSVQLPELQM